MCEKNVLLVDDDDGISELIAFNMEESGYSCIVKSNAFDALQCLKNNDIDLVLLDRMLPDIDGIELCDRIKKDSNLKKIPIIIVSFMRSEDNKLEAFNKGAVDYIVKPFFLRELIARVKVHINISEAINQPDKKITKLRVGKLSLDIEDSSAYYNNEHLVITRKEFELLKVLMQNEGIAMSRKAIMQKVWNTEYTNETRTVDVHIRNLRNKISRDYDYIITVHNQGYKLCCPKEHAND